MLGLWRPAGHNGRAVLGLNELQRARQTLQKGIDAGMQVGVQLFLARRREVLADLALGDARPGVPMRPDTLMIWMSATKPVAGIAIAQLWERGLLDLDDPVARHIPEFAANGKDAVTVRHLLTHTGGFRGVIGRWEDQRSEERRVGKECRSRW